MMQNILNKTTRSPIFTLLFFILMIGCTSIMTNEAMAQPTDMIRLKRFDIVDAQGFGQPITVATFLAPADWQLEGGVQWNTQTQCTMEIAKIRARVSSPDGKMAFEVFPLYSSMWTDDQWMNQSFVEKGCVTTPPVNGEQFIRNVFMPGVRRDAQVVSVEFMREMSQQMVQQQQVAQRAMLQQMNARLDIQIHRAKISYNDAQNQAEELILSTLSRTDMPSDNGMGQRIMMNVIEVPIVFGFKTPAGELDQNAKLMDTILSSFKVNPNYTQALTQVRNNINRIAMRGAQQRFNMQQQFNREMSAIRDQGLQDWKHQQASNDASHASFVRSIRDTELYSDPHNSGVSYELSAGYNNVWKTANDEFILTDDVNFDPNASLNGNWSQMTKGN